MIKRILCLWLLAAVLGLSPQRGVAAPGAEVPAAALAAYEEGKQAYDAGDYLAARRKFTEAIRLDPDNARWHYNLGLAQRQLDNEQPAADAFRRARELDPDYKRAEIDSKLASMGIGAEGGRSKRARASDDGDGLVIGIAAVVGVTLVGAIWWIARRRRRSTAPARGMPPADPQLVRALEARLAKLGARLVPIEHVMRLGEDADLRSLLDRATDLEHGAARALAAAAAGDGNAQREAARQLDEAEAAAAEARRHAVATHGDAALDGTGERIGCYFCARPLANADYRKAVPLSSGGRTDTVLACPVCAGAVVRGSVPEVQGSGSGEQFRHWSEDPGFDPYLNRHVARADLHGEPAWNYRPAQGIGGIAMLAAGGALAAGGTAYAATRLLDLDAARESGLAREASRASAERAAQQKRESNFSDHS